MYGGKGQHYHKTEELWKLQLSIRHVKPRLILERGKHLLFKSVDDICVQTFVFVLLLFFLIQFYSKMVLTLPSPHMKKIIRPANLSDDKSVFCHSLPPSPQKKLEYHNFPSIKTHTSFNDTFYDSLLTIFVGRGYNPMNLSKNWSNSGSSLSSTDFGNLTTPKQ